jgi:hypothetical protein
MRPVLKYALKGLYIGIWSLLLSVIVIIFTLVMDETDTPRLLIPYLQSVYKDAFIPHIISNAEFTLVTTLNYYWHWALLVLLLPLVMGFMVGLIKRKAKKDAEGRI